MIFRKVGTIAKNTNFYYNESGIDIVSLFSYLGIVFTRGGSFSQAQTILAGKHKMLSLYLKVICIN